MSLPRPQHAGMRHVALNVVDLALVESFYVDLLGFEVEWRPDKNNVMGLALATEFGIFREKAITWVDRFGTCIQRCLYYIVDH